MKARVIGTVMVCVMILVSGLVGCGGISTIDGMTGEQLLDNVIAANANLNSCNFYLTSQADMMGFSANVSGYGAVDRNEQSLYTIIEDVLTTYIVDDWLYMEIPDTGWVKIKLTDDLWKQRDRISQHLMALGKYIDAKILGTEQINGIDCYNIEVIPDLQALWDWLMDLQGMEGVDISTDLNKLFDRFVIKVWIAKDTFYIVQSSIDYTMEVLGQKMRSVETVTLYDFNGAVDINLPWAAADAEEWDLQELQDWEAGNSY